MAISQPVQFPALTGLRFFAAAIVVVGHFQSTVGRVNDLVGTGMAQIVSFFFILSGFVLCHNNAGLNWRTDGVRFWFRRCARIYPVHLASLTLLLVLVSSFRAIAFENPGFLIPNLLLIQSWIPLQAYPCSFNPPAWTISTDIFCFLCFPFLMSNWANTWRFKVGLAFAALVAAGVLSTCLGNYAYDGNKVSNPATVLYTHPFARLFEFTMGMVLHGIWCRLSERQLGRRSGTALEILTLALVIGMMAGAPRLCIILSRLLHLPIWASLWLWQGGIAIPTNALLILVMARRNGLISTTLSRRFFVLLGETSYSLYLTHMPLVFWWYSVPTSGPFWLSATGYFLTAGIVSFLMWGLVERPARTFLPRLLSASPRRSKTAEPTRLAWAPWPAKL